MSTGADSLRAPDRRPDPSVAPDPEIAKGMSASLRWTGPGRIAGRGINLLLQIVLGRALGPVGFGLYSLGFALVDVLKQFSLLGLQNGVVKFGSIHLADRDYNSLRACFRVSHVAVLTSGALIGGALFLGAPLIAERWLTEPALTPSLRMFAIGLPFYAWMILAQYWAWALRRVDLDVVLVDLLQPAASILLVSIALGLGLGLPFLVSAWAASCAISAGASWITYQRILGAFPESEVRAYSSRDLFRVSMPILFVGFSYILMGHVDKLMLAHYRGAAAVGTYTAAFRLSRQLGVIQGAMAPVFAPLVSALNHTRNDTELRHVYQLVTRWILTLSFPVVLASIFFGDVLLGLFGGEFRGAWPLLIILLAGQVINLGGGVAMQFLQMTGAQDLDLRIILTGLAANVVLNLALITRYGEMGAALATAIAFTTISVCRVIAVNRRFEMWPVSRSCWKPLAATGVAGLVVAGARLLVPGGLGSALLLGTLLLVTYGGVLFLLGVPEEDTRVFGRFWPGRQGGTS
ncbi:MAG: capsular polysaccharide biosynthesis protein [Gemmatimonadota bacterium]|nr:MAG: capsular polysaccharide biosynthesis protein [Gemmatimonadota bacterium]